MGYTKLAELCVVNTNVVGVGELSEYSWKLPDPPPGVTIAKPSSSAL
jgi:hypothetical protein